VLIDVLAKRLFARLKDAGLVPAVEPTREVDGAHRARAPDDGRTEDR
jgi:hypothetical protein